MDDQVREADAEQEEEEAISSSRRLVFEAGFTMGQFVIDVQVARLIAAVVVDDILLILRSEYLIPRSWTSS